jgi:hypothetical protein
LHVRRHPPKGPSWFLRLPWFLLYLSAVDQRTTNCIYRMARSRSGIGGMRRICFVVMGGLGRLWRFGCSSLETSTTCEILSTFGRGDGEVVNSCSCA